MDFLDTRTRTITGLALDGLYERQKAIASNTANALTPNYHRKEVEFEAQLQKKIQEYDYREEVKVDNSNLYRENPAEALKRFDMAQMMFREESEPFVPMLKEDTSGLDGNGNNVSLEREMMQTAKTGTQYTILSTLLGNSFDSLEQVIKGQ